MKGYARGGSSDPAATVQDVKGRANGTAVLIQQLTFDITLAVVLSDYEVTLVVGVVRHVGEREVVAGSVADSVKQRAGAG